LKGSIVQAQTAREYLKTLHDELRTSTKKRGEAAKRAVDAKGAKVKERLKQSISTAKAALESSNI
jgi:hypothetical protein